jgi:hypothetical protein
MRRNEIEMMKERIYIWGKPVGWSSAPLSASAFAASTIAPEAAETREPPPSLSPVVPFDDGENNGFLFDENDGQGTSDQELGED